MSRTVLILITIPAPNLQVEASVDGAAGAWCGARALLTARATRDHAWRDRDRRCYLSTDDDAPFDDPPATDDRLAATDDRSAATCATGGLVGGRMGD